MKTVRANPSLKICLFILSILITSNIQAAPGPITQEPLVIGSTVPPNIFFLTDDSASMVAEALTLDFERAGLISNALSDGSATDEGDFIHRTWNGDECEFSSAGVPGYIFVLEMQRDGFFFNVNHHCHVTAEEEWRSRDYEFNKLYYNPTRKYEPWSGVDSNGNPFEDMDVTQAKLNPFNPSTGDDNTINLLQDSALTDRSDGADGDRNYYDSDAWQEWCDNNNYDLSDCRGWRYYYYDDNGERQLKWVHELPENGDNGEINTQTNFANWFTYHRSRDYAAKYALSKVISEVTYARLGFGTINNQNSAVPVQNTNPAHRQNILSSLFSITPNSGTPLRSALNAVGQYFEHGTPLNPNSTSGFDGTSPILAEEEGGTCQRNATIMMTDGFYNTGTSVNMGNEDGNNNTLYDGGPFGDEHTNTLADIAMFYFERDLAPDLPDGVWPTQREIESLELALGEQPPAYMHQHMNTYTIVFGLKGSLDPEQVNPTDTGFIWPDPAENNINKIDDLWHAAYNGRGRFLSADNPEQLASALSGSLPDITDLKRSPIPVEVSDYRLEDNSAIFESWFSPTDWSGEFQAIQINDIGNSDNDQIAWNAGDELRNNVNRQIISFDGENGIPFQWDDLSDTQQTLLGQGDTDEGEARLDYLRGDQSNELPAGNYRARENLLGDIINSKPEYVGPPRTNYLEPSRFGAPSNSYYEFKNRYASRTEVVYVGANDGMLHGFSRETGTELLAYVPEAVYENLHRLTDPNYTHQYYVDSPALNFDAYFSPRNQGTPDWHTVLTGGLGAGGKGWYALNITNPDNFRENNAPNLVLWEFGVGDDKTEPDNEEELSDVGYSFSQPMIIATNAERNGRKRWAAITGNGYNSESGIAKLFIIFLDADPSDGWQEGPHGDYIEISTEFGGTSNTDMNGLSSPLGIDVDGDGIRDYIYAGDVKGNLWAFDISSSNANRWRVSYRTGSTPQPLFSARNGDGIIQPITARPAAIRHPEIKRNSQTNPNVMVYIGTGQYLTANDPNNTDMQSFYAIWDQGRGGLTRTDLTEQYLNATYDTTTTGDQPQVLDARFSQYDISVPYQNANEPRRFGWFFDLNDTYNTSAGERVIKEAFIEDVGSGIYAKRKIVKFYTFQPRQSTCGAGGTPSGWWYMTVDALTGSPPPVTILDLNRDGYVDINDEAFDQHRDISSVTSGIRIQGPAAITETQILLPGERLNKRPREQNQRGRLSWRELRQ